MDRVLAGREAEKSTKESDGTMEEVIASMFNKATSGKKNPVAQVADEHDDAASSQYIATVQGAACSITWLGSFPLSDLDIPELAPSGAGGAPRSQAEGTVGGELFDVLLLVTREVMYLLYVGQWGSFSSVELLRSAFLPTQASRVRVNALTETRAGRLQSSTYSREIAFATVDGGVMHFAVDLHRGLMERLDIFSFKGSRSVRYELHASATDPSANIEVCHLSDRDRCRGREWGLVTWEEFAHVYAGALTLASQTAGPMPNGSLRLDISSFVPAAVASGYSGNKMEHPVPEVVDAVVERAGMSSYFREAGIPSRVSIAPIGPKKSSGHGKLILYYYSTEMLRDAVATEERQSLLSVRMSAESLEACDSSQKEEENNCLSAYTVTIPTEGIMGSVDVIDVILEENHVHCLTSSGSYVSLSLSEEMTCECTQLLHIAINPLCAGPVASSSTGGADEAGEGHTISFSGPELPNLGDSIRSRGVQPVGFIVHSYFPLSLSVLLNLNEIQGLNFQVMMVTTPYRIDRGEWSLPHIARSVLPPEGAEGEEHHLSGPILIQNTRWLTLVPPPTRCGLKSRSIVTENKWTEARQFAESLSRRVSALISAIMKRDVSTLTSTRGHSEIISNALEIGKCLTVLRHMEREDLVVKPVIQLYLHLLKMWNAEHPKVASVTREDVDDLVVSSQSTNRLLEDLRGGADICCFTGRAVSEIPALVCGNKRCRRVVTEETRTQLNELIKSPGYRLLFTVLFGVCRGACPVCGGSFERLAV